MHFGRILSFILIKNIYLHTLEQNIPVDKLTSIKNINQELYWLRKLFKIKTYKKFI